MSKYNFWSNERWQSNRSINTLGSENCSFHRNVFQNGVNTFSKIVKHFFFNYRPTDVECSSKNTQNNQTWCIVDLIEFRRIYKGCGPGVCTGVSIRGLKVYSQDLRPFKYVTVNRVYNGNYWTKENHFLHHYSLDLGLHHFVLPMGVGPKYISHLLQKWLAFSFNSRTKDDTLICVVFVVVACFFKFCIWIFHESLYANSFLIIHRNSDNIRVTRTDFWTIWLTL